MKEVFYFPHDYNAQNDPKIIDMMFDLGWEGFGLYWALIELLAQQPDHKMRTHYERIAFALRSHEDRIKNLVENYQLFDISGDYFYSNRLISHFAERAERIKSSSNAANARWQKPASQASKNADASNPHMRNGCGNDDSAMPYKGKEKKRKENIIKEIDKEKSGETSSPTPTEKMNEFLISFSEQNEKFKNLVLAIADRWKIPEDQIIREIEKFINHWTEKTRDGKKQRWETERTFEVQRRLTTWFLNVQKWVAKPRPGGIAKIS
jgi:hypothetical protein